MSKGLLYEDYYGAIYPEAHQNAYLIKPLGNLVLAITPGLKPEKQEPLEDRVGFTLRRDGTIRLCVCDGQWGDFAASLVIENLLNGQEQVLGSSPWNRRYRQVPFAASREEAVKKVERLEEMIWVEDEEADRGVLNENTSKPSETAFVAAEFGNGKPVTAFSYGDCRLLVYRANGEVELYDQPTEKTWLGPFSYEHMRSRMPIEKGVIYTELPPLKPGDRLIMFTDGVSEPEYETPCLSNEEILGCFAMAKSIEHGAIKLLDRVMDLGAEDHTSFIAYQR